ncbi:TauD/TfdA family dioxygenase [Luteibacter aegosomaticola]|uniref:TauD/TfdA family dioxygenase n=1 Tax=Luteibacter aegosomaticola TaxID=2911538 RepID=UPI001FFB8237|nr:TauD/TfdA family dioxygenase [Luteibacter aegosomaticola]UPG89727.1 TauD/TfdA family dioxygenase [Luteibacter aegosomaticola]
MNTAISDRPRLLAASGRSLGEIDDDTVWSDLARHGAVLFRGFGVDADAFHAYASRFSRGFLLSPFGDRKPASDRNELQTVTVGQAALDLHFEYGNSPLRPDLLWFYCRRAPREGTGGETLVADGAAILEKLSPEARAILARRRIRFRNYVPPEAFDAILTGNSVVHALLGGDVEPALASRGVSITERSDRRVVFEFAVEALTPVHDSGQQAVSQNVFTQAYKRPDHEDAEGSFSTQVTWEDGSEIDAGLLDELRLAARSITRGIRWQTGDFVLIDNYRVLHGRNQTSDPERDLVMLCSFSTRFDAGAAPIA